MNQIIVTLVILGLAVIGFASGKIPTGLVALGAALALLACRIITLPEAFAGFSDSAVILIASLFVVAEGLDASGLTGWAGKQLSSRAGSTPVRITVLIMLLVAGLTALISVNGAVAALLPVTVVTASRLRMIPSRLLLPLAFAAHAGSMLVLTGSPVNVIIAEFAEHTGHAVSFFSFTPLGLVLLAGTLAITALFGRWLIPARKADSMPADLSDHARTLLEQYTHDKAFARLRVRPGSPLIGKPTESLGIDKDTGVQIIAVQGTERRPSGETVSPGDRLVVRGETENIKILKQKTNLAGFTRQGRLNQSEALIDSTYGAAEIVVTPRSELVGDVVFPGMVNTRGDMVVLAVQRSGETLEREKITLEPGDILLVQGRWETLDHHLDDPNLLVVDNPDQVRRQAAPLGFRAWSATIILTGMVVLLATGLIPAAIAGLLAASAMVLTGVVTVERAHRSMSWTTLLLVAGMIPMSTAITKTGAAELIASSIVNTVGSSGPLLVLFALCLVCCTFGQLISNTATALIITPVAISIAAEMHVSPMPFLMGVAVCCAAAFLTPVATPANFMVKGPAGLHFGDYWRYGLCLLALFIAVSVFLVPVLWPFTTS